MSAVGERQRAKAKEDTRASGAKPRPEGRVREHGWRPIRSICGIEDAGAEAARRRAIEQRPTNGYRALAHPTGGRE